MSLVGGPAKEGKKKSDYCGPFVLEEGVTEEGGGGEFYLDITKKNTRGGRAGLRCCSSHPKIYWNYLVRYTYAWWIGMGEDGLHVLLTLGRLTWKKRGRGRSLGRKLGLNLMGLQVGLRELVVRGLLY